MTAAELRTAAEDVVREEIDARGARRAACGVSFTADVAVLLGDVQADVTYNAAAWLEGRLEADAMAYPVVEIA
jgi:hypothetical protein